MTIEPRQKRGRLGALALLLAVLLAPLALLAYGCASGRPSGLSDDEVAKLPAAVADSYELFAHKCSRCHSLARPLAAPITELAHWEAYVARMRRQASSDISEDDAMRILVFLRYYAAGMKVAAEADRAEEERVEREQLEREGAELEGREREGTERGANEAPRDEGDRNHAERAKEGRAKEGRAREGRAREGRAREGRAKEGRAKEGRAKERRGS